MEICKCVEEAMEKMVVEMHKWKEAVVVMEKMVAGICTYTGEEVVRKVEVESYIRRVLVGIYKYKQVGVFETVVEVTTKMVVVVIYRNKEIVAMEEVAVVIYENTKDEIVTVLVMVTRKYKVCSHLQLH